MGQLAGTLLSMPVVKFRPQHYEMPETLEGCLDFLVENEEFIDEDSERGRITQQCYLRVKEVAGEEADKAKQYNPLKFLRVSFEQSLKLNAWIWGLNLLCDFDANRMGKTAGAVFNFLLWIVPNNPVWRIFKPYIDKWGRRVEVFQRPSVASLQELIVFLDKYPQFRGDPKKSHLDPENAKKLAVIKKYVPQAFKPSWPEPSYTSKQNTIWVGAPDVKYHKEIVMPEINKWIPSYIVTRRSEFDMEYNLEIRYRSNFGTEKVITWDLHFKSYESKDTKWSGAAVRGIILTEGLTSAILDEIKQRFQADAFGSWDYTPYEPRNTGSKSSLAHKVYDGKERLPLRPYVFTGFGIEKCPDFILDDSKREDLYAMWGGKKQGKARIHGLFYTSSPLVLDNYEPEFHNLPWRKEELFRRIPNLLLFRGFDPGYDHPTACCWAGLAPGNTWYVYRYLSERGLSIGQRCKKIIEMSGNKRYIFRYGKGEDDYYYVEYHPSPDSEVIVSTIADYHVFKRDETTGRGYQMQYTKEGVNLSRSVTMAPRDRGVEVNRLLEKNLHKPHPLKRKPPGSRIFFLINEEGVSEACDMLKELFWDRYSTGDQKGEPKDEMQSHGDDEFDAGSYLFCSPLRWDASIKSVRKYKPDFDPNIERVFTTK